MEMSAVTTIQIKKSTVKKLVELKTYDKKQESYDDVINRIIKKVNEE